MDKKKIIIPRQLFTIVALVVVLDILRIMIFHSTYFVYLLWNLFLAILPFVVSSVLLWHTNNKKLPKPVMIIGLIIWLVLLPNAPYIVTDLIHLGRNHAAPMLYDTFLIFSAGWAGLLLGMYSISHVERIILGKYSKITTSRIIGVIILLSSFGIYLGRFMRYNSWDIIARPLHFLNNISNVLFQPLNYRDAYFFTGLCFIFIWLSYKSFKYSQTESRHDIM